MLLFDMTAHTMVKCTSLCNETLSMFRRWRKISHLLSWWERLGSEWMIHLRCKHRNQLRRITWSIFLILTSAYRYHCGSIFIFNYFEAVDWADDEHGRCVPTDTKQNESSLWRVCNKRGEHSWLGREYGTKEGQSIRYCCDSISASFKRGCQGHWHCPWRECHSSWWGGTSMLAINPQSSQRGLKYTC